MKVIHPRFSLFLSRRNHVPCDLNKSTPQDRFSLPLLIFKLSKEFKFILRFQGTKENSKLLYAVAVVAHRS